MSLKLPTSAAEVDSRTKTDIQRELPGSNPFLKNSVLGALATSNSNRIFDYYTQLEALQIQLFPDTAEGVFLERWAAIFGLQRLAATKSTGNVVATGTVGASVPILTVLTASDGTLYDVTATSTIANALISVMSITRVETLATVTTTLDHGYANNVIPTIANVDQTEYNGAKTITVIAANQFTFIVSGSPTTPATPVSGITSSANFAITPVESQDFQNSTADPVINVNQDSGTELTLQSPLVNIDDILTVDFGELGGGSDQETDTDLRTRLLDRIQNPVANFNVSDITETAKQINGVTRVFVKEVFPALGQVTIFFMRDNDTGTDPQKAIPTASERTIVKNQVLTIKPANTADDDVIFPALAGQQVDFTFTALTPNTTTMQTAVEENLTEFFATETEPEVDIDEDAYRAAIKNTVDPETGDIVQTFVLSNPIGDISVGTNLIGVLGTVTFP